MLCVTAACMRVSVSMISDGTCQLCDGGAHGRDPVEKVNCIPLVPLHPCTRCRRAIYKRGTLRGGQGGSMHYNTQLRIHRTAFAAGPAVLVGVAVTTSTTCTLFTGASLPGLLLPLFLFRQLPSPPRPTPTDGPPSVSSPLPAITIRQQ